MVPQVLPHYVQALVSTPCQNQLLEPSTGEIRLKGTIRRPCSVDVLSILSTEEFMVAEFNKKVNKTDKIISTS